MGFCPWLCIRTLQGTVGKVYSRFGTTAPRLIILFAFLTIAFGAKFLHAASIPAEPHPPWLEGSQKFTDVVVIRLRATH